MNSMTHDNPQNITLAAERVAGHRVTKTQPECPEWCEVSQADHEAEAWSRTASWFAHSRRVTVGDASIYVGAVQMFEEQIEPGGEARAADELEPRIWVSGLDNGDGMTAEQAIELAEVLAETGGRKSHAAEIFAAGREYQARLDARETISVSVRDASQLTSFSEYEIRQAINRGDLEAVKLGRRFAIPLHALTTWRGSLPKVS